MNPQLPFFLSWSFTVLAVTLVLGMAHSQTLADDPFAPKPAVPPGFMVVGGDILVPEQSPLAKMKSPFRTARPGIGRMEQFLMSGIPM